MAEQDAGGERPTVYHARVTAPPEALEALRKLDLDVLPEHGAAGRGEEGAFEALLEEGQLREVVATGAKVELLRLIDPRFPEGLIMSDEQAEARLEALRRYRERGD